MSERPDGYYWVRSTSGNQPPYVRFANKSTVLVQGWEIGPPASMDDSEQLAKAREVLGRIREMTAYMSDVYSRDIGGIIDESGVRL